MKDWEQLSIDKAQQHPLYGVKGWLLSILVLMALNCVVRIFYVLFNFGNDEVLNYGISALVAVVIYGVYGMIVYMGFIKDHRFPKLIILLLYASAILLIGFFLTVGYFLATGNNASSLLIAAVIAAGLISGHLLLIWFFKTSKRVNVTYLHRVPKDD